MNTRVERRAPSLGALSQTTVPTNSDKSYRVGREATATAMRLRAVAEFLRRYTSRAAPGEGGGAATPKVVSQFLDR
jgi:hypothetical protein